jgi:hypothetical protein
MLQRAAISERKGFALRRIMDELILLACLAVGFGLFSASAPLKAGPPPQVPDLAALCASLPTDLVNLHVQQSEALNSYFIDTLSNAGAFDGVYPAWCIDARRGLVNLDLFAFMYCGQSPAFAALGLIDHPENMDLLDYILNQHYVGKPAISGGVYTVGDVQRAIWELLSIPIVTPRLDPWDQTRVDEITADALANGEGYTPPCGGVLAIALVPFNAEGTLRQIQVIEYPVVCEPPPPEIDCETAYGRLGGNNTCFIDLGFDNWGWTNGPLGPGTYVMELWAGAGQCDTSKGALVGTVTVVYNGSSVTVTYDLFSEECWLTETHLYVGSTPTPLKKGVPTVAPGQYPYQHELDEASSDSFTVSASGNIYVIAHAVVCCDADEVE